AATAPPAIAAIIPKPATEAAMTTARRRPDPPRWNMYSSVFPSMPGNQSRCEIDHLPCPAPWWGVGMSMVAVPEASHLLVKKAFRRAAAGVKRPYSRRQMPHKVHYIDNTKPQIGAVTGKALLVDLAGLLLFSPAMHSLIPRETFNRRTSPASG